MINRISATVLHLSFLPAYFVQRTVAQWLFGATELTDMEAEMAEYVKELGHGA